MPDYTISAKLTVTCNINLRDIPNASKAEKEAMDYFDNSANLESDFYNNIDVTEIEIWDVNEDN